MELHTPHVFDISTIENILPLDLQFGAFEKQKVPHGLDEYFNRTELNAYVLIDAASVEQHHEVTDVFSKHTNYSADLL